ncbi:Phytoene dehydrogenase-related protein [Plantibacter sp. VKM Ac-1784]|uniref:Phytoene dehydrogenase-related protein n=1 Tax=Plantibacter elymi (nom. nud.) TaxID=199708 RepID=A0ABY1RIC6_9MICO|nr:NAD(P)/FAD-dependent oxidoreductase [Plantibacter sp. VKM Ac-1784]SMQ75156.1 Phytoene dehydrogenase-related protein [Plantibacter sp. VKM Ac-1784]
MHFVEQYDAVIVGGGHNGLTAAAYLARAGKRVLLLERLDHTGGAAVSERPFPGVDARLSRYSYLVSLLPQRIIDDLGLDVRLVRRRFSSYTPDPANPGTGLLIDNRDDDATVASFASIGHQEDAAGVAELHRRIGHLASVLWPTVLEPLRSRSDARDAAIAAAADLGVPAAEVVSIWSAVFDEPIGRAIEGAALSDLVRGVVFTDALIGTFARADDQTLQQNICFLYHLIGGGTGDWDVPVGGMGAVTDALRRAAEEAGAEIRTLAEVTSIQPEHGLVAYVDLAAEAELEATEPMSTLDRFRPRPGVVVRGEWILSGAAPVVLEHLLDPTAEQRAAAAAFAAWSAARGTPVQWSDADAILGTAPAPEDGVPHPEGAQVKVNLLLRRLPKLLDPAVDPAAAFGGTFHINEGWAQLEHAYREAEAGRIPDPLPCEVYCHTLSDPSILSPELQASGAQTLTVFGLHVPHRLAVAADAVPGGHDAFRDALQTAVLRSLDSVIAEPIEDLLLLDAEGRPCIETRTTLDLERSLAMPGGNIFHGPLSWPFLEDDAPRTTAAERWGVATAHPRVLLCGAGARRGGAVSGLGGHNAAMAVLDA